MDDRDKILEVLKNQKDTLTDLGVREVGLFGSVARNQHADNSDIDILIDFYPEKETYDNFLAICDVLENLFKDKKVEVVTRNGLSPYIGPYILKEVVYVS
ncbi:MAG: nucleotidyltransferase family protein [Bacteroidales bacterium]|nr:nucleotidyltransferase family protein [Bacteroidales bacterium]